MSKGRNRQRTTTSTTDHDHETEELNEASTTADILRIVRKLETTLLEVKNGQSKLESKLESLSTSMDTHHNDIKELKKSTDFLSQEIADISSANSVLLQKINEQERTMEVHSSKLADLQNRLDDTERYSRGYNLRFLGLPEETDPSKEYCKGKIEELIQSRLELNVDIENAHRTGRQRPDNPRPIIAKFLRRPERFCVLRQRHAFKEDEVSVFEDLIAKDYKARKNLATVVTDARRQGKKTKFIKDSLIIDGRRYVPEQT